MSIDEQRAAVAKAAEDGGYASVNALARALKMPRSTVQKRLREQYGPDYAASLFPRSRPGKPPSKPPPAVVGCSGPVHRSIPPGHARAWSGNQYVAVELFLADGRTLRRNYSNAGWSFVEPWWPPVAEDEPEADA